MPPTLAAWLHDLDPFAIQFTETFGLRWYGLSYLAGFVAGYLLIRRVCAVGVSSLHPDKVGDFIVALAIGVVVGGRLGYVFFYQPDLLWQFTGDLPFWGVLAINEGGMASHGGIAGTILASGWFAWKHGHRWLHLLDLMAFGAPLGLMFGRLANFINGELYGRVCSSDFAWAVRFPQELYDRLPRPRNGWSSDPGAALYPVVEPLGVSRSAWFNALADYASPVQGIGDVARAFVHTKLDQALELVREGGEQAVPVAAAMAEVLPTRHPSQLYAAALEGLLVFAVLALLWMRPRRTGIIGAWFCVAYAVARFTGEFFRLPDEQIGLQWLDLSRGQWLSAPVLLTGIVALIVIPRLNKPVMGSWRAPKAHLTAKNAKVAK